MAWVFGDSFDHYTDLSLKYDLVVGFSGAPAPSISPTAGRNGTSGLVIPQIGFREAFAYTYVQKNVSNQSTYITGCAICVPASQIVIPNVDTVVFAFWDGSTVQCSVAISKTGQVTCYRGVPGDGTFLASSSVPITFDSPQYLEAKATIGLSGAIVVHLNGVQVLSFSGNTQATATTNIGGVTWGAIFNTALTTAYNYQYTIDDLYLIDTTGAHNTNFLGDVRAAVLYPTAAGNYTDWTATFASWASATVMAVGQQIEDSNGNVQRVTAVTGDAKTGGSAPSWATTGGQTTTDNHVTWTVVGSGLNPGAPPWMAIAENPPDGDDSYISTGTVGNKSTFAHSAISASGTIAAVQVSATIRKDDGGADVYHAMARLATVDAESGDQSPSTSYGIMTPAFEVDPSSNPWTFSNVNSAEFGLKKIS